MKKEFIAADNSIFFVVVIGMALGMDVFTRAVLESFGDKDFMFPTDPINQKLTGYIKIDFSAVVEDSWGKFTKEVMGGLFSRASYEFSSMTKFKGDLAEQVEFKKGGYTFSFHIKEYERDMSHKFKIITPEEILDVPEKEKIGRVAYLTITPIG
ncbi:MAG: hypothetical protein PF549_02935 [Patescibacteria group bacterium]|jgi:hypothetical protein|nr:hypothetical protein [Patescibacteria group bacterium]